MHWSCGAVSGAGHAGPGRQRLWWEWQMQPTLTLEKGSEGSAGATVHFRRQMYLKWLWSGNTDYHVKALAVQVWLLSSTPGTHVKMEGKQPPSCPLTSAYMSWHRYPPHPLAVPHMRFLFSANIFLIIKMIFDTLGESLACGNWT